MSTPTPHDDAQRELERRALRNVRGLVDKMQDIQEDDSRAQRRLLAWVLVGALAVVAVVGVGLWHSAKNVAGKPVVIDPAKLPPIRPGPPPK
jgi:hypothetical protein